MDRTLRFIDEHLSGPLTLRDAASHAGYSTWYFCEKFKRYTGVTFVEYVRSRRMYLSCREMQQGKTVTDVAMKYGYESISGFERAFLSAFGCSPSEYLKDVNRYTRAYEERRKNMTALSNRLSILRENALNHQERENVLVGQYMKWHMYGYRQLQKGKTHNALLKAACIASLIDHYPTVIFDGEMVVGNNYGCDRVMNGDTYVFDKGFKPDAAREYLRQGCLTKEEIEDMIAAQMAGDTYDSHRLGQHQDWFVELENDQEKDAYDELAAFGWCLAQNHTVLGYEMVLQHGFEGLLARVRSARGAHTALSDEQRILYDAMEQVLLSACKMGDRFAHEALRLAEGADEERAEELRQVAAVCRRVPRQPAHTFHEAVQSLWFAHIINTWEDGVNANSLGRLDQILYPYYQKDVEDGRLTREMAFELLGCLWLKLYRDYDVQQSMVGGCDREGNCAVNDLSYLMLDVTEAMDFVRCLSVRISRDTPLPFIKRALEVVRHVQKGVPFFFNDDVMIPALVRRGIAPEDARDYAAIGCVEICIPGKANPHAVTGRVNMLKALEYALSQGKGMVKKGRQPGLVTPNLDSFKKFDDLKDAVKRQVSHLCRMACAETNRAIRTSARDDALPYKSLLTEGCIESGLHFNAGGPKYNYYQMMLLGIPNLADSLMSIRRLVYEENRYTLQELVHQLAHDFPDEAVRQDCLNRAPKFGNDQPQVDALAAEMMEYACRELENIPSVIGNGFHPQPFTFLWMHDHGACCAASADGRHAGEVLAYSVSPMQGRDFCGLTAMLNSLSALPTRLAPGCTSAIVEVDPYLFTDKNMDMIVGVLMAAAEQGLCNVQFNTIDRDTLVDAKKHPEKHRNLAVRVSGFSQRFVLLDAKMQDHIIRRTKHTQL